MSESTKDWVSTKLGTICTLKGGNAFSEHFQGSNKGKYPFIKVSDMNLSGNEKIIRTSMNWVDENTQKSMKAFVFPKGSVVFAKVGAALLLNRRRIISVPTLMDNNMMGAIPSEQVTTEYLYQFLNTIDFGRQVQDGAVPSVNQEMIGSIAISLPPLIEQNKIAEILSAVDRGIELSGIEISKVKMLFEGTREETLKPKKDWMRKQLQDLVAPDLKITYGIVQAGPHISDGVPYIRTGDMLKQDMNLSEFQRTSIEIDRAYARSKVTVGDIVCALRGEVGRVIIVPTFLGGANLTQGTARISVSKTYSNKFIYWALQAQNAREQFKRATKGTSLQEITLDALRKIEVVLPADILEQKRLVGILEAVSEKYQILRRKLRSYKFIKSALMSDLLSGRVRVRV